METTMEQGIYREPIVIVINESGIVKVLPADNRSHGVVSTPPSIPIPIPNGNGVGMPEDIDMLTRWIITPSTPVPVASATPVAIVEPVTEPSSAYTEITDLVVGHLAPSGQKKTVLVENATLRQMLSGINTACNGDKEILKSSTDIILAAIGEEAAKKIAAEDNPNFNLAVTFRDIAALTDRRKGEDKETATGGDPSFSLTVTFGDKSWVTRMEVFKEYGIYIVMS